MNATITLEIPRNWLEGLSQELLNWQHIIRLGLQQYKLERALQLYLDGVGSMGFIAEQLDISKQDLIRIARIRGIEPEFSAQTVAEELAT